MAKSFSLIILFSEAEYKIVAKQAEEVGIPIATYLRYRSLLTVCELEKPLDLKVKNRSKPVSVRFNSKGLEILDQRTTKLGMRRSNYIRARGLQSVAALKKSIEYQVHKNQWQKLTMSQLSSLRQN
jgi:hypothetical protein